MAVHGGLDRDPETGVVRPGEKAGENPAWTIAERFPQLAAIVYGHSHQREEGRRVNGVLLVQPRNWGMEVARVDLVLERGPDGRWTLASAKSRLLPVTLATKPDPRVMKIARPYHEAAERWLDQPVAQSAADLSGARGRFEDTALVDAIHEVQLHYSRRGREPHLALPAARARRARAGHRARGGRALRLRQRALRGRGQRPHVHEALENAARYFRTCPEPSARAARSSTRNVRGYNYDMAQGVEYEIDLTARGQRVVSLRYHGAPLRDDEPLRIAVNSYRAGGSAGYTMFRGAKIVWRSNREIRELLADYWSTKKELPEKPDCNWKLLPEGVVETLVREESGPR